MFTLGNGLKATLMTRAGRIGAAILAGIIAFSIYDQSRVSAGRNQAVAEINKSAETLNVKARKARSKAATSSDPVAELRRRYCGNCQ